MKLKWERINETCLRTIDSEGNVWHLTASKGKYLGRHYGYSGYDAVVQLAKNGNIVESCSEYAWSSVKHLTPKVLRLFDARIE